MECHLSEKGYGSGDTTNYTTVAKVRAWCGERANDRPVVVFNLHMESSEGSKDFAPRIGEIESLIEKADKLLQADHLAFNRARENAPDKSHPKYYQNRFIVMGDWNTRAHECGEHYWMVRKLREHFGYAMDVSMAQTDVFNSLEQTMYTDDGGYGSDDVPVGYQHMEKDDPRSPPAWTAWNRTPINFSPVSKFPWWAADWRDRVSDTNKVGEKLSMIVLVGKGWAYDDPVLDYIVMSDSNHISPMNLQGQGVEMWRDSNCLNLGSVKNNILGYRPNYSLGCDGFEGGGTKPGVPALHSDHRPMMAFGRGEIKQGLGVF